MELGKPSRTALSAAMHRAAHQLLEGGGVFADPLAVRILGASPREIAGGAAADRTRGVMRLFIAVRTRFAEDALAKAVEGGVEQLVILGAGLDTFAYRSPFRESLRIFEVDHPATQEWKRHRLAEAGIAAPSWLTFAPVNFETQSLAQGLSAAGFDEGRQTFFTWLGVVPYLTEDAIFTTLRTIAGISGGARVVFDYSDPPESLSAEARAYYERRAAHVESLNEPWVSSFEPEELHGRLKALGFSEMEDLGPREIRRRYFPDAPGAARERGGHVLFAANRRQAMD